MPPPPDRQVNFSVTSGIEGISFFGPSFIGRAPLAFLSAPTSKAVSPILSGLVMRSSMNLSSGMPEATSITRPSRSVDMEYSQVVPGW